MSARHFVFLAELLAKGLADCTLTITAVEDFGQGLKGTNQMFDLGRFRETVVKRAREMMAERGKVNATGA